MENSAALAILQKDKESSNRLRIALIGLCGALGGAFVLAAGNAVAAALKVHLNIP